MTTGQAIVAEARRWIDTPFEFQQSCRGAGADCKGFIVGVARECGLPAAQSTWARIADYQRVDPRLLRQGLEETMDLVAAPPEPGDLLLIRLLDKQCRLKPQHMAIYCGNNRMIHTMWSGPSRVRETPMCELHWKAVDSIWRWRV